MESPSSVVPRLLETQGKLKKKEFFLLKKVFFLTIVINYVLDREINSDLLKLL